MGLDDGDIDGAWVGLDDGCEINPDVKREEKR